MFATEEIEQFATPFEAHGLVDIVVLRQIGEETEEEVRLPDYKLTGERLPGGCVVIGIEQTRKAAGFLQLGTGDLAGL